MFSHSCLWFRILENDSQAAGVFSHLSVVLITQTLKSNSQARYGFSYSHQRFWSAQTLEKQLTTWKKCLANLVVLICSKAREQLTSWTHVQSFSLVFWTAQKLESNSHTAQMFGQSHKWFWCVQILESNSRTAHMPVVSHGMVLWSAQTLESIEELTFCLCVQPLWSAILIDSSTWRVTDELDTSQSLINGFWSVQN